MEEILPPIEESSVPNPPRFRWLRRLGLAVVVAILAGVGVWFCWDYYAQRQLDQEIARLHSLGQRVTPADFNDVSVPPAANNAATLYLQVAKLSYSTAQKDFDDSVSFEFKLTPVQLTVMRSFKTSFAVNLQTARQARGLDQAYWYRVTSPMYAIFLSHLTRLRTLTTVMGYSLRIDHLDGHDGEAIETARDMLHLSKMIDQNTMTMVEHLMATSIANQAAERSADLAGDLSIGPAPGASPAQARALIDNLLSDSLAPGLILSLKGEQAIQLECAADPALLANSYTDWPRLPIPGRLLFPVARLDGVRVSKYMSARIATLDPMHYSPNFDDSGNTSPRGDFTLIRWVTRPLSYTAPYTQRALQAHFQMVARRRAAATLLAIRLYQLDHAGRWPDTLADLVPAYLPAVQEDPFAAKAGQPLVYRKSATIDGVQTPAVYSVGEDGIDQGGSTVRVQGKSRTESTFDEPWDREDAVFPFLPPPRLDQNTQPSAIFTN